MRPSYLLNLLTFVIMHMCDISAYVISQPADVYCIRNDGTMDVLKVRGSKREAKTRITMMSLVEQELLTLPEHLSSSPDFSGARVTRSLVFCVCFVDRCLSFCTFSFVHCVVCLASIYGYLFGFGNFLSISE